MPSPLIAKDPTKDPPNESCSFCPRRDYQTTKGGRDNRSKEAVGFGRSVKARKRAVRDAIVRTCEGGFGINGTILVFFGVLWDDFEGGTVADGLTRLCSTDPPPPELYTFNANQQSVLIGLAALSPSLFLVQETSSSIASSQDTDGTLYSVELEHDATEELAAMRVALSAAWAVAKTRCGMDKEDFGAECPKLFDTDSKDFQTTFEFVVRQDNSEPQARQDGATADSDFDTISKAATNAFAEWCKWKGTGAMERLFFEVLKLQ